MTHSRQALLFYANGCSCEQSIFGAFADALGVSPVKAMQMAPRRSERQGQCGALSAACKVISMVCAHYPYTEEKISGERMKREAAAILRRQYLERWGTTDCNSIQAQNGRRGCDEVIVTAAAMVERMLTRSS